MSFLSSWFKSRPQHPSPSQDVPGRDGDESETVARKWQLLPHEAATSAPLQLIRLEDSTDRFSLTPEGRSLLAALPGKPLVIITVAGLYRTGKSYLLNALLDRLGPSAPPANRSQQKPQFRMSSSTDACTKGIWVWGEPVPARSLGLDADWNVLFCDTEGLGDAAGSAVRNSRIFAMSILLSSVYIYNSMGAISSTSIDQLGAILKVVEAVIDQCGGDSGTRKNSSPIVVYREFFPLFWWLLRDFSLELRSSPDAYLESCLQGSASASGEAASRHVRQTICELFPERRCSVLVRPASNERDLRQLGDLPAASLRPEFQTQLLQFRGDLIRSLRPKASPFEGVDIDGPAMVLLADAFCASFNSGAIPNIPSVMEVLLRQKFQTAVAATLSEFSHDNRCVVADAVALERFRVHVGESNFTGYPDLVAEFGRGMLLQELHSLQLRSRDRLLRSTVDELISFMPSGTAVESKKYALFVQQQLGGPAVVSDEVNPAASLLLAVLEGSLKKCVETSGITLRALKEEKDAEIHGLQNDLSMARNSEKAAVAEARLVKEELERASSNLKAALAVRHDGSVSTGVVRRENGGFGAADAAHDRPSMASLSVSRVVVADAATSNGRGHGAGGEEEEEEDPAAAAAAPSAAVRMVDESLSPPAKRQRPLPTAAAAAAAAPEGMAKEDPLSAAESLQIQRLKSFAGYADVAEVLENARRSARRLDKSYREDLHRLYVECFVNGQRPPKRA